MTVKVDITSASGVDAQGRQKIVFEVSYKKRTLISHTIEEDVDNLKSAVESFVMAYKQKYYSTNRYTAGDSFNLEV